MNVNLNVVVVVDVDDSGSCGERREAEEKEELSRQAAKTPRVEEQKKTGAFLISGSTPPPRFAAKNIEAQLSNPQRLEFLCVIFFFRK